MLNCKINQMLKKQGKSQARLAELTAIPTGMISQIASGRSIPTNEELSMICGALGCRREELYDQTALQLITGTKPKEKKPKKTQNVRMTSPITKMIDQFAAQYGLSRDAAARMLVMAGNMAVKVPGFFKYEVEKCATP